MSVNGSEGETIVWISALKKKKKKKDNRSLFDLLSPSKNRNGFHNQSAAPWPWQKGKNKTKQEVAADSRSGKAPEGGGGKKGGKAPPKRRLPPMPHFHHVWKRRPHIQRKDKDNVCPLRRCSCLPPDRLQQEFNSAPL